MGRVKGKALGVTLIELLLVVAIILTLSVLSTGFYSRFLRQNAVANAVDGYVGALRKAQIYAMTGKQAAWGSTGWGVQYSSNTITVFLGNAYATRNAAFDERFSVNSNVTISGLPEVDFARITGIPNITGTITFSSTNTIKTIAVNGVGNITR